MARSSVYIGVDLQPDLFRFVVIDRRGKSLMSGERKIPRDGHSWSHEFGTLLQNDENRHVEKQIEESKRVWGFAPSFASGLSRSIFVPVEARPLKSYVEWETSLYLGAPSDQFFLSWEVGSDLPGGNFLHITSVRKQEFQGFSAGLSSAGVTPVLIEGTLFSAWNALSRLSKKKLPPTLVILEEGGLFRLGYFEKGSLVQQALLQLPITELSSGLLEFLQRGSYQPEQFFHQVEALVDEEEAALLSTALSVPLLPLPSGDLPPLYAVAHSAAQRSKEVDQ